MNLAETLQLLDKLNIIGAKHFKSQDFEISMKGEQHHTIVLPETTEAPHATPQAEQPSEPKYTPTKAEENTRRMQALIDLMEMKNIDLANTIFPEGA